MWSGKWLSPSHSSVCVQVKCKWHRSHCSTSIPSLSEANETQFQFMTSQNSLFMPWDNDITQSKVRFCEMHHLTVCFPIMWLLGLITHDFMCSVGQKRHKNTGLHTCEFCYVMRFQHKTECFVLYFILYFIFDTKFIYIYI